MALHIHLFGVPRFEQDNQPLAINRRKAIAILAYLAVTAQPHSRDTLATLFWPENDQSTARANLRRDLYNLKQALGDDVLKVTRADVALVANGHWHLDTAAFTTHLAEVAVHKHPKSKPCMACQALLTEAVALYQDDFMAGFNLPDCSEFDDWQFFQREGLKQSLADALQQLIEWGIAEANYGQTIDYSRRWLALDNLHEPAHRMLMKLYAWDNQQTAALRQYDECVRLLDEELGIEPEPETHSLYEAIKSRQFDAPQAAVDDDSEPSTITLVDFWPRYRQEEQIAVGGHGELYLGVDQETGKQVVIKRLRPELIKNSAEHVTRFQREGEALRQLNHPNIVKILDSYEDEGHYCIVMEYVPGGSLRSLLKEQKALPVDKVVSLGLELADALSRAHHLGIIHRDIKPENVLLAADGTPRLTDFGVARLEGEDVRLTRTGSLLGSPAYMSPEALKGEELDARSDLWSLGVLLYEMLTGVRPFKGDQIGTVMVNILTEDVPEISRLLPDAPLQLSNLISRMLIKDREERPATSRLVAAELEAIKTGSSISVSATPPPTDPAVRLRNIPVDPAPFIGRDPELAQIRQMLEDPACRLLSIIGLGGMGKSRLGLEALRQNGQHPDKFRHGVYYVPLAGLDSADTLPYELANALGLSFHTSREDPVTSLINYLKPRETLILLDNVEHLLVSEYVDEVSNIIGRLLKGCPDLKFLTTSREPLLLDSEWRLNLEGLSYHQDKGADNPIDPAAELFLQAAKQQQPDFELTEQYFPLVHRLCHLVSGIPLALKLAAAWLKVMSLEQVVAETERALDFLITRFRDIPPRQRSMRAVFDYSWNLLEPAEQRVFCSLSLFKGYFYATAAREVAGATPFLMAGLVDRSLVQAEPTGETIRYGMHELVRQYAAQQIPEAERTTLRIQYSRYYADKLHHFYHVLQNKEYRQGTKDMGAEMENIRHAWQITLELALEQPDLAAELIGQFTPALYLYYYIEGPLQVGRQTFNQATQALQAAGWDQPDSSPAAAERALTLLQVQIREAFFSLGLGDYDAVDQIMTPALPQLRVANNTTELAMALMVWGKTNLLRGQRPIAETQFEESLALFRQIGDRYHEADSLKVLGVVAVDRGHHEETMAYYNESLSIYRELGFVPGMTSLLHNIGTAHFRQNDLESALQAYQEALSLAKSVGYSRIVMESTGAVGGVYRELGKYQQAEKYFKQSVTMARDMGEQRLLAVNLKGLGLVHLSMQDFSAAQHYLGEGLKVADSTQNIPDVLSCMSGFAYAWAQQGLVEKALRALWFVEQQRATRISDRRKGRELLEELQAELPQAFVEEAREWAAEQTLEEMVAFTLAPVSAFPF